MNVDPTMLTGAQLLEIAEAMNGTSRYTMRDEKGKVISIIIVATGVNAAAVDRALEEAGLFIIETPQGH
jgi:coenzyme F420-reducing hydrogenase alpha subunit